MSTKGNLMFRNKYNIASFLVATMTAVVVWQGRGERPETACAVPSNEVAAMRSVAQPDEASSQADELFPVGQGLVQPVEYRAPANGGLPATGTSKLAGVIQTADESLPGTARVLPAIVHPQMHSTETELAAANSCSSCRPGMPCAECGADRSPPRGQISASGGSPGNGQAFAMQGFQPYRNHVCQGSECGCRRQITGVDGAICLGSGEPDWGMRGPIPWEMFAQGEYVGPPGLVI